MFLWQNVRGQKKGYFRIRWELQSWVWISRSIRWCFKKNEPRDHCTYRLVQRQSKEGKRVFRRMFICFDACRRGWKDGCRPIIGLDGCFLKGICKGQLLSAVGIDGNNRMFPIAYAVVEVENTETWKWFWSVSYGIRRWKISFYILSSQTNIRGWGSQYL